MTMKTERELDLENLKQLQEAGEIDKDENIELIADKLPRWRKGDYTIARRNLAYYGRDCDLDNTDWRVRSAVALRGRDQDLDKLVGDKDWYIRKAVAQVGRDKDVNQPRTKVRGLQVEK